MIEVLRQELNRAWGFYKQFEPRSPKDDGFYHDIAKAYCETYAAMRTDAGRRVLRVLFETIDGITPPRREENGKA